MGAVMLKPGAGVWIMVCIAIPLCLFAHPPVLAAEGETGEVIEIAQVDASDKKQKSKEAKKAKKKKQKSRDSEKCDECDEKKEKQKDSDKCKIAPWVYQPHWYSEGDFSGELEFRYSKESLMDSTSAHSRDYGAYFGYRMRPYGDWTIQLGLKTGRDNRATSSWIPGESLDDTQLLSLKEYWLRHTKKLGKSGELRFQAGRFNYPFDMTQIVFDSDLYLPAAFVERRWKVDGNSSFKRVSLGLYAAELRDKKDGDRGSAMLNSARLGLRWENGGDSRVDAALSYLDFSNVDTLGRAIAGGSWRVGGVTGKGETTNYWDGLGVLESDYTLVDLYAKGEWLRRSDWPVELELEFVKNMAARGSGSGEDTAWFAGVSIGPNDDPGDWQFGAQQVWIESDAVLANVNRGEYATNYESQLVQARFIPAENLEWKAVYAWSNSLADRGDALAFDDEELKLYLTVKW